MVDEVTCETSTVVGLGFKNLPDADDYRRHLSSRSVGDEALFQEPLTLIIDGVSHLAESLDLCNNSNGGVLDSDIEVPFHVINNATLDKLSAPQRAGGATNATVSDDIKISVHGTQESNPSDATNGAVSHMCYELDDSEIPESSGPTDSCAKSWILVSPKGDFGVSEAQEVGTIDNRVEASGLDEAVACGNNDFPVKSTNIIHGEDKAVKCPWRIQIIDGTALIETSLEKEIECGAKKEKRLKRKVKTGKKKNSRATEEIVKNVGLYVGVIEKKNYNVYSRKELEALRFQGLDAQKRRWVAVYSGLGAALQKEYDGLVHFQSRLKQLQEPQQQKKKKKKKKNVNVNVNPQFQNQGSASFLGPWVANQGEYPLYSEEWPTGIFGRHVQNIF